MSYMLHVIEHHNRNSRQWRTPGTYRVPEDIPDDEAQIIIRMGRGVRMIREQKPAVAPMPAKMPAPENKIVAVTENKEAADDPQADPSEAAPEAAPTGRTGAGKSPSSSEAERAKSKSTSRSRRGGRASSR